MRGSAERIELPKIAAHAMMAICTVFGRPKVSVPTMVAPPAMNAPFDSVRKMQYATTAVSPSPMARRKIGFFQTQ